MRRVKAHLWHESPIVLFDLAIPFVIGRGKHQNARVKNRAENTGRLNNRHDDNERSDELSRCHQDGATGLVTAGMRVRIL